MNLTWDEFQLYMFTRKYPGWMSYNNDSRTRKAVNGLAIKGLIQLNQFQQLQGTAANGDSL